ncbi:MAG TPA: DUF6799 domain-containing protein, partial [Planctomycetota bacterium]|nr:DUF6799 domain-containing protein [Planctomycetota bacterium]
MRLSIALLLGSLCFVSAGFAAENDGYFMVDGKAMTLRNGTVTELKTETTLDDGSRLLPDGTLVMRDGKKSRIAANK